MKNIKIHQKRLLTSLEPILAIAGLTFSLISNAALVTANATIDLSSAITEATWTGEYHALENLIQVQSGDTITINIDFSGNQKLTTSGSGYFNPWLILKEWTENRVDGSQSGSFNWSNVSSSFIGLSEGSQYPSSQFTDGTSGNVHLGPTHILGNDDISRTFSGVTLSFMATWDDGDPFREYTSIGYEGSQQLFGSSVSYAGSSVVPVPAAAWLFGSALAGLGLARRKK